HLFKPGDAVRSAYPGKITYWLKKPAQKLTLEILDGSGQVIRTFNGVIPTAGRPGGEGRAGGAGRSGESGRSGAPGAATTTTADAEQPPADEEEGGGRGRGGPPTTSMAAGV